MKYLLILIVSLAIGGAAYGQHCANGTCYSGGSSFTVYAPSYYVAPMYPRQFMARPYVYGYSPFVYPSAVVRQRGGVFVGWSTGPRRGRPFRGSRR